MQKIKKTNILQKQKIKNNMMNDEALEKRTQSQSSTSQSMIVQFENKKSFFKKHPLRELQFTQKWKLCSNHFQKQYIRSMFEICDKVYATHIYLNWNKNPMMIKEIENTQFPNLQIINFGGNQINNVEALSKINMPRLKELHLWLNFIVDITSFRKASFKQLQILDLGGNFIKNSKKLNETSFHENIKKITIDDNRFYQINDFVPLIVKDLKIDLINNKFIHIGKYPSKKGKKDISSYSYLKNEPTYF